MCVCVFMGAFSRTHCLMWMAIYSANGSEKPMIGTRDRESFGCFFEVKDISAFFGIFVRSDGLGKWVVSIA